MHLTLLFLKIWENFIFHDKTFLRALIMTSPDVLQSPTKCQEKSILEKVKVKA